MTSKVKIPKPIPDEEILPVAWDFGILSGVVHADLMRQQLAKLRERSDQRRSRPAGGYGESREPS